MFLTESTPHNLQFATVLSPITAKLRLSTSDSDTVNNYPFLIYSSLLG